MIAPAPVLKKVRLSIGRGQHISEVLDGVVLSARFNG
jgi:hypothetical protein